MTAEQLLIEAKKGLNIPVEGTNFDSVLSQKINAVKGFISGAGVTAEQLDTNLGVGLIVIGVTDLWNIQGGDVRFSKAFHTILAQLAAASLPTTES